MGAGDINCNTVKTVTVDHHSLQCRALVLAVILGFCCRDEMSCWHIQYVDFTAEVPCQKNLLLRSGTNLLS